VRTSQQHGIVQCLLASGCWVSVDHEEPNYRPTPPSQVPRLKRLGQDFHILLWSEDICGLKVDGELCEVPHICSWNAVLAEPRFYHPPPPRVPAHHVLPNPGVVCMPRTPDQTPPPLRPKRTPVFIPTIPRYIDACLAFDSTQYSFPTRPRVDIEYLIRYLFLELDGQREKLLPLLLEEHRGRMEEILNRYIRTVKADLKPGGRGTGRKPFLLRMKEKKVEQSHPEG
jgi:hypothetical protein